MSTTTEEEIDYDVDVENYGDMVITLHVGPGGLDRYLELVGDRTGPRIKCLDGSLTLVSPSYRHERGGKQLELLIELVCDELEIDYEPALSTLLRPPGRKNDGIEPDLCYWIQHAAASREIDDQLDLSRTPPPDLVVEVVVSNPPSKSLEVCRLLGIPEVWVHRPRSRKLQFLHLENGNYVPRGHSLAFPFLSPKDVLPWLQSTGDEPLILWKRRLRDWVRNELGPRRAGG